MIMAVTMTMTMVMMMALAIVQGKPPSLFVFLQGDCSDLVDAMTGMMVKALHAYDNIDNTESF